MFQKVFIIWWPGSGKSYLAKILWKKFGLPHFELDDIFWEVKYTKRRDEEEKKKELSKIMKANKKRIIEGIFYTFIEEALLQADEIIRLDIHPNILSRRIFKRYISGLRKNTWETFKSMRWLIKWTRWYRKPDWYFYKHKELLEKHNLKFISIKNKKQFNQYTQSLN